MCLLSTIGKYFCKKSSLCFASDGVGWFVIFFFDFLGFFILSHFLFELEADMEVEFSLINQVIRDVPVLSLSINDF